MNGSDLSQLYTAVAGELRTVAETIRTCLAPPEDGFGGPLVDFASESVGYLLRSPGKLLRPVLVLCSGRLAGGPSAGVLTLAAAVELLHAASLAHDDVLDEEHVRRGVRSLNREHGNQVAVLSGDVLYAKFFALLTRVELPDPGRLSTLFALFARTTERMCIGIVTK